MNSCEPSRLGAVKLHKVLYYSDMLSFIVSGKAITGAEYRKRPFGPTCDSALAVIDDLARDRVIDVNRVEYYGYYKKEFVLRQERPDTNYLAEHEKRILDEIIEFVCNSNSAKTISEFSHDMVWDMVEFGDVIPYYNAIHLVPNDVSLDAKAWAAEAGKQIETAQPQSHSQKLAFKDVGTLRERMAELSRS